MSDEDDDKFNKSLAEEEEPEPVLSTFSMKGWPHLDLFQPKVVLCIVCNDLVQYQNYIPSMSVSLGCLAIRIQDLANPEIYLSSGLRMRRRMKAMQSLM
jgi:hypothetical protein